MSSPHSAAPSSRTSSRQSHTHTSRFLRDESPSENQPEEDDDGSHFHHKRNSNSHDIGTNNNDNDNDNNDDDDADLPSVPVETLVEHLLAARRALATMSQVLRCNSLATEARQLQAESVAAAAQTALLQRGVQDQADVLVRVRGQMGQTYDTGRKTFRGLLRTLDEAHGQLEETMEALRETTVAAVFRPAKETEPRSLLDFVDEAGVDQLRDAIKASIGELQAAQVAFDGDLLRFDTDLRALNKAMAAAPAPPPPLDVEPGEEVPSLLLDLTQRSHIMAENLASLNRHFDLCVTAVRATEGGREMARWKAAQAVQAQTDDGGSGGTNSNSRRSSLAGGGDPVSISGVISDENDLDLASLSARERAEMVQVVLQDAAEVDDVVADMAVELHAAEAAFHAVRQHHSQQRTSLRATVAAVAAVDAVGARLRSYAQAEAEFVARWSAERAVVASRLADMDALRGFYEGYRHAYETAILEAERRRTIEAKIQTVWRKARDAVERLVDVDAQDRDSFRLEVGEFLPTDLWVDMDRPPRGYDLFWRSEDGDGGRNHEQEGPSAAAQQAAAAAQQTGLTGDNGPGGSSTRTVLRP